MVAISATSPGATIRYTIDGITPGQNSPIYTGPIRLSGNTTLKTLKARGFRTGFADSTVQSVTYGWSRVPTPVFTPTRGRLRKGSTVTASTINGAEISYSVEPGDPQAEWRRYSGPILLDAPMTFQAIARLPGWEDSLVASAYFGISDYESTVASTLAGSGEAGTNDGPAYLAQFNRPEGIAMDSAGRIPVADTWNSLIRRIDTNGMVSTIAGSGVAGDLDGPANVAQFNYPSGIAVDHAGNIYVADRNNNSVRRIATDGAVVTLARIRVPPAAPSLDQIEVSPNGIAYVGSWASVVKVMTDGSFTDLAGPGVCCPSSWSGGIGVGLMGDGDVFASMGSGHVILRISPGGEAEIYAGGVGGYSDGQALNVPGRFRLRGKDRSIAPKRRTSFTQPRFPRPLARARVEISTCGTGRIGLPSSLLKARVGS